MTAASVKKNSFVDLSSKSPLINTLSKTLGRAMNRAGEPNGVDNISDQVALIAMRIFNSSSLHKDAVERLMKEKNIHKMEHEALKANLKSLFSHDADDVFPLIYSLFYEFSKRPYEEDSSREYTQLFYQLFKNLKDIFLKGVKDQNQVNEIQIAQEQLKVKIVSSGYLSSIALEEFIHLFHSALLFEGAEEEKKQKLKQELEKIASNNILRHVIAQFSEGQQEISRKIKSKVKNNETFEKLIKLCQYAFSILIFERLKACNSQALGKVKESYLWLKDKHPSLFYLEFQVKRLYKEGISPVISHRYFLKSLGALLIVYLFYSIYSNNKKLDKLNSQILDIVTLFFIFQSLNKGLRWLMKRVKTPGFQEGVQKNYEWIEDKYRSFFSQRKHGGGGDKKDSIPQLLNNLKDRYYSL